MNSLFKTILAFCSIFSFNLSLFSGTLDAQYAMGSRVLGMGQSATLSFSGALSALNNPARLVNASDYALAFYYGEPIDDAKNICSGAVIPL